MCMYIMYILKSSYSICCHRGTELFCHRTCPTTGSIISGGFKRGIPMKNGAPIGKPEGKYSLMGFIAYL